MAKQPKNHGKQYTAEDIKILKKMAPTRPVGIIANELGRTEQAIYQKAAELKISFERPERSPYAKPQKKKNTAPNLGAVFNTILGLGAYNT